MRGAKSQRLPTRAEGHCRFPLSSKITAGHLALLAIIYVRQSSARQVRENVESTQLQYRLVELARALGWPDERIVVIDEDLGLSARAWRGA